MFYTDCSSAKVIVHLRNRGTKAYRPDVYGRTIVVERRIGADGKGWNYKIKGLKGSIVSNKKEELISILDHCKIQVGPPSHLLALLCKRLFLIRYLGQFHIRIPVRFIRNCPKFLIRKIVMQESDKRTRIMLQFMIKLSCKLAYKECKVKCKAVC